MTTDKNKQQFEKWFLDKPFGDKTNPTRPRFLSVFLKYPFEMQIGVYLAYYDSIGYKFDIEPIGENKYIIGIICNDFESGWWGKEGKPLNEAYKEAFKKANEIANNDN